jgi:hypothetical protein
MLPHGKCNIDNLKKEITREKECLETQLLKIDLYEASLTEKQAKTHPLLQQLKDSYIIRAENLAQKEHKHRKHNDLLQSAH